MMKQWFMWCGVGAIEDLEDYAADCNSDEEAIFWFKTQRPPCLATLNLDWTLWAREDNVTRLLAVKQHDRGTIVMKIWERRIKETPAWRWCSAGDVPEDVRDTIEEHGLAEACPLDGKYSYRLRQHSSGGST